MLPLSGTRQIRFIAKAMLYVWLIGLTISWANACILQAATSLGSAGYRHASPLHLTMSGDDASAQRVTGHEVAGDPDEPRAGRLACKSFCDIEQRIVAKSHGPVGQDLSDAIPPLMAVADAWLDLPPARADAPWRPPATPPPPGPPVSIVFLRLTI